LASDTGAPTDNQPAVSRRLVAIVNPATHGNAAALVDLLRRHAPADADLDVRLTPAAGTTTALTHEALAGGARAVVAVGGDGTVAAVATALRGTGIPLGMIPGGSTNVTARSLDIPAHPTADPALPVELDGDVVASTPFTVQLAPAALNVIVPAW
jgi:diacylglycerol kinase family enzyme